MSYNPRTKPRAHQVKALGRIANRPSRPSFADVYALLMEYGTGKSKVITDEFGTREEAGDLHDLLVIAGAGSYLNWVVDKNETQPSEFNRHMSDDLLDRLRAEYWMSGGGVGRERRLNHLVTQNLDDLRRPRALVINIEALSTSVKARELVMAFLKSGNKKRRSMAVVDECTSIKDDASQRTKACLVIGGEASSRRILTGMVTPNNPVDLFSQFEFLDWHILGYNSKYAFRNRFCVMKKIEVPIPGRTNPDGTPKKRRVDIDVAYRNLDELNRKIEPYSYRVLTEECLDLPPLTYAPLIDVELTKEQRRVYNELREFSTSQLSGEDHVTATMVLTRNLRLQQVLCGFTVDENGEEHDIPSNRGAAVMRLLEEHSGKAIIWVPFHRPLDRLVGALEKVYGPGSVAQFHGKNTRTRGEDERRFLGDPNCRFMVSTQQAGGRGNTWTAATLTIYFANTFDLEIRMNSERRFYRDGQRHPCTIVDFAAAGTNEMKTIVALREKLDIAAAIMGDNYREWLI